MWNKTAPLLIVLSVSLNAAFIGVWVVQAAREQRIGPERHSQACEHVWCPLHRRLDVTDEQWNRLEPRLVQFRSDSESLCQDIHRKREELIDLIVSPQPDREAIAAKQEEILADQRQVQELVIALLLDEKQMLTAEQQAKLFHMIRERTGCGGGNTMGCSVPMSGVRSQTPAEFRE